MAQQIDPNNLSGTATIMFDEEFNSLNLWNSGSGTWDPGFFWQPKGAFYGTGQTTWIVNPNNPSAAAADPFSVSDGVLTINASPTDPSVASSVGYAPYTSGMITTYHSFAQTYGYFEIMAKLPSGPGFGADFWLLPAQGPSSPELDVMEVISVTPEVTTFAVHSNTLSNGVDGGWADVPDTSAGFHAYGVDWEPDYTTWYFDGAPIYRTTTPSDMNQPMYLVVDEAVGAAGSWGGAPTSDTSFPGQFQIDYIRAYEPLSAGAAAASGSAPTGVSSAAAMTVRYDSGTSASVPILASGRETSRGPLGSTITQSASGGVTTISFDSHMLSETVQLGSGTHDLVFLSPNALVLTGGSGTDTVTADSGPAGNLFTAGTGTLDVTGGSDGSAYYFHASSGVLKIEDFDFAKGDSLAIDQTLKGAFTSASDAHGGSLLTFGTVASINVVGRSGISASDIQWI